MQMLAPLTVRYLTLEDMAQWQATLPDHSGTGSDTAPSRLATMETAIGAYPKFTAAVALENDWK